MFMWLQQESTSNLRVLHAFATKMMMTTWDGLFALSHHENPHEVPLLQHWVSLFSRRKKRAVSPGAERREELELRLKRNDVGNHSS